MENSTKVPPNNNSNNKQSEQLTFIFYFCSHAGGLLEEFRLIQVQARV